MTYGDVFVTQVTSTYIVKCAVYGYHLCYKSLASAVVLP